MSCLPNFSKFESDAKKVSRDITSARADMKRLEGRIVQHSEDFGTTKIEVTKLGNYQKATFLCTSFVNYASQALRINFVDLVTNPGAWCCANNDVIDSIIHALDLTHDFLYH